MCVCELVLSFVWRVKGGTMYFLYRFSFLFSVITYYISKQLNAFHFKPVFALVKFYNLIYLLFSFLRFLVCCKFPFFCNTVSLNAHNCVCMYVCVNALDFCVCVCVFEIYHFLRFHNTTLLINGSQFDLISLQTPPANSAHCAAYVEAARRRRPSILLYFVTLLIFFLC